MDVDGRPFGFGGRSLSGAEDMAIELPKKRSVRLLGSRKYLAEAEASEGM